MLEKISEHILLKILSDETDSDLFAVCKYGCELWLYTVISTLGLCLFGLLCGAFQETILIISIFYLCQSNGGGFHAASHTGCFLTMLCGLIAGILVLKAPLPIIFYSCLGIASIIILYGIPLQLHPNKKYLHTKAAKLRRKSLAVTSLITAGVILCKMIGASHLFSAGCAALTLSAISRLCAKFHHSSPSKNTE